MLFQKSFAGGREICTRDVLEQQMTKVQFSVYFRILLPTFLFKQESFLKTHFYYL